MRICIVGVGAIGTWVAARLSRSSSVELSCLVKPQALERLRAEGLSLIESHQGVQTTQCVHPHFFSDAARSHYCPGRHNDSGGWCPRCVRYSSRAARKFFAHDHHHQSISKSINLACYLAC